MEPEHLNIEPGPALQWEHLSEMDKCNAKLKVLQPVHVKEGILISVTSLGTWTW